MSARVLVLAPQPFYQNRGTPIATRRLLELLGKEGYQLDLVTYPEGETISLPNCAIHRVGKLPFVKNIRAGFSWKKLVCDAQMLWRVWRMKPAAHWDLIHANEESVFIAWLCRRLYGIPYVYDMDSLLSEQLTEKLPVLVPLRPFFHWVEGTMIRDSSGVVAVCQSLETAALKFAPHVPIVRFEDSTMVDDDSLPLPEHPDPDLASIEGKIIMYVGNLETYQGIDLLLDAFAHVYHKSKDAQLVVIGGTPQTIGAYQAKANLFRIADRVHFLGPRPVDQLAWCFSKAHVLVSPRILGTNTPMKIYSYMASRVPIVATRLSTHCQALDDDTAMLVHDNPLDFAQGIVALLNNSDLCRQLADQAYTKAVDKFSEKVLDGKLAAFYESLFDSLQKRPSSGSDATQVVVSN